MDPKTIYHIILSYFFRGLLLVVPISIVIYVIYQLFMFFDALVPTNVPGLGLLILLTSITALGYLGSSFIAQPILVFTGKMLNRIPLVKTVYSAVNDLLSALVGNKKSFDKPVLVKMNRESDIEKLGFITSDDLSTLNIHSGKIAVYLPHSYNFSGNLYIVPAENITPVKANTAEFMKFIVSGGVTTVGQTNEEI